MQLTLVPVTEYVMIVMIIMALSIPLVVALHM